MPDVDLQRLLLARRRPPARPLVLPGQALIAVVDTNVVARSACSAVRSGRRDGLFSGLATTGRSNLYMGAHVPTELANHLGDVATSNKVSLVEVERVLWDQIMPRIPVVDLTARDCLSPRTLPFLHDDPLLPRSMRGDPDDFQTVAVAEFLAPAVILSADSVFARLGMADSATAWIETARNLLRAAGIEATFADAASAAEMTLRLLCAGIGAAFRLANRYPLPVLAVLAAGLYLAARFGYLNLDRPRTAIRRLTQAAQPVLDMIDEATDGWQQARGGLFVIEPDGPPTLDQLAGRYLARSRRALTPSELRDLLKSEGHQVTAAGLKRAMTAHPAFSLRPGDLYTVGRRGARTIDL